MRCALGIGGALAGLNPRLLREIIKIDRLPDMVIECRALECLSGRQIATIGQRRISQSLMGLAELLPDTFPFIHPRDFTQGGLGVVVVGTRREQPRVAVLDRLLQCGICHRISPRFRHLVSAPGAFD